MAALPRFMVLYSESVGKYLRHPSIGLAIGVAADKAWEPQAKFEVEPSAAHPSMVHIKCSYNNKYLQPIGPDLAIGGWICPMADRPNENLVDWRCTLFQPEFRNHDATVVQLLHTQRGRYVTTLLVLPKHLAFKVNYYGYLGLIEGDELSFLRFEIDDQGERSVASEVVPLPDGTSIRIKNVSRGAYWRQNGEASDFVLAEDDLTTPGPDSLFQPIKVDDQTIVLRNLGNNRFASRDGYYLRASEIEPFFSDLTLYELVSSRRIKDIEFLLEYGWVHDETLVVVVNPGEPVTNESGVARTLPVEIRYKDVRSCTLKANGPTLTRLGPVVRIQPDEIGSVSDSSKIELVAPFEPSYLWGPHSTELGDPDQVKVHEVTVPPWSTVTVKLTASLATCNIPFTYTRYDVLDESTGKEEIHFMEDGLYTGTNYFNFKFEESAPQPVLKEKN
ncbi:unnamed protein product [Linum tenue]|uniref:Agglutinin domain-containing protein n=1 Tax=Linum tenue TaxID=586396 RepID=A0AAV0II89_9ROSI|nr:unnamed protein product [Linum tenue]